MVIATSKASHLVVTTRKEIPTEKSVKPYSNIGVCRSKEWLGLRTIKIDGIAETAWDSISSMARV
jgi:hypothetical protein